MCHIHSASRQTLANSNQPKKTLTHALTGPAKEGRYIRPFLNFFYIFLSLPISEYLCTVCCTTKREMEREREKEKTRKQARLGIEG